MTRQTCRLSTIAAASLLLFAGAGCSLDNFRSQAARRASGTEQLTFARELGVNLERMKRTESGLYYFDRAEGAGTIAEQGKDVRVGYQGWLPTGRLFDQSPPEQPYEFTLGVGQVIQGWDEGIVGMKVGGRRLLVIPPSLAYGDQSPGAGIPPHSTLVFDVTLVGVRQ